MLKFFSKSSSVLATTLIIAGTTVSLSALSQSAAPNLPATSTAPLLVIQGKVTAIQGNSITVKTPDTRTSPVVIIAGPTFSVDITNATFQTTSGTSLTPKPALVVGTSVVVAGTQGATPAVVTPTPAGANKLIIAEVVAKTPL